MKFICKNQRFKSSLFYRIPVVHESESIFAGVVEMDLPLEAMLRM